MSHRPANQDQQIERQIERIIEASFTPTLVHDGKVIVAVNTAVTTTFGYTPSELLGQSVRDVIQRVAPDAAPHIEHHIRTHQEKPYQATCLHKSGEQLAVEIVGKTLLFRQRRCRVVMVRVVESTPYTGAIITHLPPRQRQILTLIAAGQTNRQIGDQLSITVNTVKYHLKQLYQALNVTNRQEAISWYWQYVTDSDGPPAS